MNESNVVISTSESDIYTPLTQAYKELQERRQNKELCASIKKFFGDKLPSFTDKPHAFISRPIATPNFELRNFIDHTKTIGLDPIILEYPGKLVAKNPDKYHLCMMYFHNNFPQQVIPTFSKMKIADISAYEGKLLGSVETNNQINIQEFHHAILLDEFPSLKDSLFDFNEWFNQTRNLTDYYYLYYLMLFLCNGILFDNFFFNDTEESKFIAHKFLPSFERVKELFGIKPLIVPLLPLEDERSHKWLYYPGSVRETIKKIYNI